MEGSSITELGKEVPGTTDGMAGSASAELEQHSVFDEEDSSVHSVDRSRRSFICDDTQTSEPMPVPPMGMARKLWKVASVKTSDAFETTQHYEERTKFNVAKMLRAAGQGSQEGSGKRGGEDLWNWAAESSVILRVGCWAPWVSPPSSSFSYDMPGGGNLCDLLIGDTLYDPVGTLLRKPELDTALSVDEVKFFKECLLDEFRVTGKVTRQAVENYLAEEASPAIVSGPEHAVTRAQIRLVNQPLPGLGDPSIIIRSWYCSQGIQPKAMHTCAQVDGSPLLLGTGPNGGHDGLMPILKQGKVVSNEYDRNLERNTQKTRKAALPALMLHGSDINKFAFYSESRDTEIAGFLTDMLEMQVRCVVACGFVHAHEEDNLKVLLQVKGPHANLKKLLPDDPLARHTFKGAHSSYMKGAPRDFFNYFGSPQGSDGLKWRRTETAHGGLETREARVHQLKLRSTMMARDDTLAPQGSSYKVAVFKLEVCWHEGFLFFGRNQSAEVTVVHIQVQDQAPLQLTRSQVRLLYNAVAGLPPDSVELGFEKTGRTYVHCHAGIGRTGNIAFGLSELLCANVPSEPAEKLAWLRRARAGAVQTPEQLVDGLQLATGILDEVFERVKYVPLLSLQKKRDKVRDTMEAEYAKSQQASPRGTASRHNSLKKLPKPRSAGTLKDLLKGTRVKGRPSTLQSKAKSFGGGTLGSEMDEALAGINSAPDDINVRTVS